MSSVIHLAAARAAQAGRAEAAPRARLHNALLELRAAAEAVYPDITCWRGFADPVGEHSTTPVIISAHREPKPIRWDGPGIYEFRCPAPKWAKTTDTCQPIMHLDLAPERHSALTGEWFEARDFYRGRFQGKPRYFAARDILIIRKLEAMPAE